MLYQELEMAKWQMAKIAEMAKFYSHCECSEIIATDEVITRLQLTYHGCQVYNIKHTVMLILHNNVLKQQIPLRYHINAHFGTYT